MKRKLTKKLIDSLRKPEGDAEYWVHDADTPGFCLRVSAHRKVFCVRYGDRRRRRLVTIGVYGAPWTPEDALTEARSILGRVADGKDPAADVETKRKLPTFKGWAAEYLELVKLKKKSWRDDARFLPLAVERFGTRLITEVTTDDVARLFQGIAVDDRKPVKANRVLASVRACLQAAWRQNLIPSNPAMRVRPMPESDPRTRVLTDEELGRLGAAIEELPDRHVRAAFVLLLTTGARRSEVLRAKWADLDLDAATWRVPSTKSGRPQTIPLPAPAVAVLRDLERVGPFVVPGRDPQKPRADLKKPWDDLRKAAGLIDKEHPELTVRGHDIRRTFGLALAKKAGLHIASRLLRHSDVRVTERHYAPLGLAELAKASEAHSRSMAKVLPFMPKATPKRRAASGGRR